MSSGGLKFSLREASIFGTFFVREVPPFPLWFYYTLPYVLEQGMKIHNTIQYNNTEKVHNMYNNTQDQLRAEAV